LVRIQLDPGLCMIRIKLLSILSITHCLLKCLKFVLTFAVILT
jgi:hypothetical protein